MFWWASRMRVVSFKLIERGWNELIHFAIIAINVVTGPYIAWSPFTNLFGLVLLCVAWGNKALSIHLHGLQVRSCLTRRGRQALHLQEWLDVPHFWLVGAVGHRLALGGQDARCLPLGILRFLYQWENTGHWRLQQWLNTRRVVHVHAAEDLTLSHLMYTSFIPSATGSRSFIPNFLSVTLTSGTTSQPEV